MSGMSLSDISPSRAPALARFGMNSPNARRLVPFYEQAFGAQVELRERQHRHRFTQWIGVEGVTESTVLSLGDATVELLEFDYPGRPYPPELSPYDTRFQHLGIVVTDMHRAMERLTQTAGWTAISIGGPQRLPENDGGVTAFKFRDPDGHPLEFLQFASGKTPAHWRKTIGMGIHLGIDHSALSVADATRSMNFYESLGLALSRRSLNQGIEQEHLDGVPAPIVDVISLTPQSPTPHVELLHYRTPSRATHEGLRSHDTAATRLVFVGPDIASKEANRLIQDPDGHFLQFEYRADLYTNTTT
jgi:catechol 2,3-dioxygenase-like lactoylglutathione lyase family enzyme